MMFSALKDNNQPSRILEAAKTLFNMKGKIKTSPEIQKADIVRSIHAPQEIKKGFNSL